MDQTRRLRRIPTQGLWLLARLRRRRSITPGSTSGSDIAGSDTESTSGSPGEEVEALGYWARQDPQAHALSSCGGTNCQPFS